MTRLFIPASAGGDRRPGPRRRKRVANRPPERRAVRHPSDEPRRLLDRMSAVASRVGRLVTEENRRWWTLAAVSLGLFMIMLDNTVVNVALPSIQRDLERGSRSWNGSSRGTRSPSRRSC